MPALIIVTVLIQACFIFHVFKTGRPYWWAFIILTAPVLGSVVYYFVEVFPGSSEHRSARRSAHKLARSLAGDRDLRERLADTELCASVDNRLALARECADREMHAQAIDLYQSCLEGAYADDPAILLALTGSLIEAGRFDAARDVCTRLIKSHPDHRAPEVKLARARILEGLGEPDMAISEYRELVPMFVGFEARYRYAALLMQHGLNTQGLVLLEEILKLAERQPPALESELAWVKRAKQLALAKS